VGWCLLFESTAYPSLVAVFDHCSYHDVSPHHCLWLGRSAVILTHLLTLVVKKKFAERRAFERRTVRESTYRDQFPDRDRVPATSSFRGVTTSRQSTRGAVALSSREIESAATGGTVVNGHQGI
jgi:hypothetical protein